MDQLLNEMMNKIRLVIGLLLMTSMIACAEKNAKQTSMETPQGVEFTNVDAQGLKEALSSEKKMLLLDVRTPGEVSQGKITSDAKVIDFYDEDFSERLKELDKSMPIYVYCKAGGRSSSAAKMMVDQGFEKVYNLNGGVGGWVSAGYELSK